MEQPLERQITRDLHLWAGAFIGALVVIAIFALGGYFLRWSWTGIGDQTTLWDWLSLLLLPLALAALPIWFNAHHHWDTRWTLALVVGTLVLAALLVGTNLFNWGWTGFGDHQTVWDWLNLLLLPLGLAILPVWFGGKWGSAQTISVTLAVLLLAVLIAGTYLLDWATWTGFKGQTFWDWFSLLIRPVAVTVAAIWFSAHQRQINEVERLKQQQQPASIKPTS